MQFKGESLEQVKLVNWLNLNWYHFFAVTNESDGHSYAKGAKRKAMGVKKGVPDMFLILKRWWLLAIELKKPRWPSWWLNGSHISPEQLEWNKILNSVDNVAAEFCHWFQEAVETIEKYESV